MAGYESLHARWYDLLYEDKSYEHEAAFVDRLAGEPGGHLLDVGCGTGRHASAFVARGYRVTGIDINRHLLEHARAAAPSARFVNADMRKFELSERFDLVTCLFDTIGYALTNEGVESYVISLRTGESPWSSFMAQQFSAGQIRFGYGGWLCPGTATCFALPRRPSTHLLKRCTSPMS
jgi:SAM-dependent methyltransferase